MRVQVFNATGLTGKASEVIRFTEEHSTDILATLETMLLPTSSIPIRPAIHNHTVDIGLRQGCPEGESSLMPYHLNSRWQPDMSNQPWMATHR